MDQAESVDTLENTVIQDPSDASGTFDPPSEEVIPDIVREESDEAPAERSAERSENVRDGGDDDSEDHPPVQRDVSDAIDTTAGVPVDNVPIIKFVRKKMKRSVQIEPPIPMKIQIKELSFDLIRPNRESVKSRIGGSKLTVIGKPGSGKSVLIKALLYAKRDLIPVGVVVSGSEDTNHFYEKLFPPAFIYDKFKMKIVEDIHKRQTYAMTHLPNPWQVFIMDDCMDDVKIFNNPTMIGLMKNSRHWSLLTIISTQYCLDFKPVIRNNMDGVFIFRDPNLNTRDKLYKNFCSIIPTFPLFCQIMDDITEDYTCLYIDNFSTSNNWMDCVYYMKAPLVEDFQFGCKEFWDFSEARCK